VSATSQGVGAGIVIGICAVLLGQQFSLFSLSDLTPAIEYLVIGAVVGGVIFGVIGWGLGRRYVRRHPPADSSSGPSAAPPS
jgi:tetrahydromethanopterin S-methyltransferase subunit C